MTGPTFRVGAATHVGMIRTMNEDAFVTRDRLFAVADGMGGHLAGEVASAMAIEALTSLDGHVTADAVVTAVLDANHDILQMSRSDASRRGMGTTLTALAVVHPDDEAGVPELAVVNLGDSRTYRFRNGRLEQVTVDHSYVQELVSGGHLTPDEARHHPQRNIVTRALGIEPDVGIDVWNLPIIPGDRYLLCSDGLVDEVTDHSIATVLSEVHDPGDAARQLVDLANRSGGRDNVTVVVVDVEAIDGAIGTLALEPSAPPEVTEAPEDPVTAPLPVVPPPMEPDGADPTGVLARVAPEALPPEALASEAPPSDAPLAAALAAPAAPVAPAAPAKKSRTNLALVAGLGGAAVLAGIVLVAVRNAGDDDEPAPTSIVTTVAPAPTPAPATTTISGVPSPPTPTTTP